MEMPGSNSSTYSLGEREAVSNGLKGKLLELAKKTTFANVAAFVIVITAMGFAVYTNNENLVNFLVGAAVGYLLKRTS